MISRAGHAQRPRLCGDPIFSFAVDPGLKLDNNLAKTIESHDYTQAAILYDSLKLGPVSLHQSRFDFETDVMCMALLGRWQTLADSLLGNGPFSIGDQVAYYLDPPPKEMVDIYGRFRVQIDNQPTADLLWKERAKILPELQNRLAISNRRDTAQIGLVLDALFVRFARFDRIKYRASKKAFQRLPNADRYQTLNQYYGLVPSLGISEIATYGIQASILSLPRTKLGNAMPLLVGFSFDVESHNAFIPSGSLFLHNLSIGGSGQALFGKTPASIQVGDDRVPQGTQWRGVSLAGRIGWSPRRYGYARWGVFEELGGLTARAFSKDSVTKAAFDRATTFDAYFAKTSIFYDVPIAKIVISASISQSLDRILYLRLAPFVAFNTVKWKSEAHYQPAWSYGIGVHLLVGTRRGYYQR